MYEAHYRSKVLEESDWFLFIFIINIIYGFVCFVFFIPFQGYIIFHYIYRLKCIKCMHYNHIFLLIKNLDKQIDMTHTVLIIWGRWLLQEYKGYIILIEFKKNIFKKLSKIISKICYFKLIWFMLIIYVVWFKLHF